MESTMPAKAAANTVLRAVPFMSFSFSFRPRFESARLEPSRLAAGARFRNQAEKIVHLSPSQGEPPPAEVTALGKNWSLNRSASLLSGHDLRCHQSNVIHTGRLGDIDHVGHGAEVHIVFALDEHDALGAVGIDIRKSRLQIVLGYVGLVDLVGR